MVIATNIQVHLLPVAWLVLVWLVSAQIIGLLLAPVPGRSLVAWSVNLLGITPIYLQKPPALVRLLQLLAPLLGAGVVMYESLGAFMLPITGVPNSTALRIDFGIGVTIILAVPRLVGAIRELRFPLWGEARMLDRVARVGTAIYFTAAGRAYLLDRFGATPEEFLRIVRRRSTSLATNTPR